MLKLKTNKEVQLPNDRGTIGAVARLIVDCISMNKNHIKAEGYYYYYDENNNVVLPPNSKFGNASLIPKETLEYLEANVLANFGNPKDLYLAIKQRLYEITMIQLSQEAYQNYGTVSDDWIIDDDVITQNPIM